MVFCEYHIIYFVVFLQLQGLKEAKQNVFMIEESDQNAKLLQEYFNKLLKSKELANFGMTGTINRSNLMQDKKTNAILAVVLFDNRVKPENTILNPLRNIKPYKTLDAKSKNVDRQSHKGKKEHKPKIFDVVANSIFDGLNITNCNEEKKTILRKRWRNTCNKKISKSCKKACIQATKNSCQIYHCNSKKKREFRRECKSCCKYKFESGSDDEDESDSSS